MSNSGEVSDLSLDNVSVRTIPGVLAAFPVVSVTNSCPLMDPDVLEPLASLVQFHHSYLAQEGTGLQLQLPE